MCEENKRVFFEGMSNCYSHVHSLHHPCCDPHSCHIPHCMQASRASGCRKTAIGLYQSASSPLRQQQARHVVTNIQLLILDT